MKRIVRGDDGRMYDVWTDSKGDEHWEPMYNVYATIRDSYETDPDDIW